MNNVGLFIVSYEISSGLMGAPVLRTDLVVSTPSRSVSGHGTVSTDSGYNVESRLGGDFTYMTVMPNNTHILVSLQGVPLMPAGIQNMNVRMVLEADWTSGNAAFSYMDANGRWITIDNAKVTKVNSVTEVPAAEALAAQN